MIINVKKKKQLKKQKPENSTIALGFLKSVKSGKLGPIEKTSLKYSRVSEKTEIKVIDTDEFYYSMS